MNARTPSTPDQSLTTPSPPSAPARVEAPATRPRKSVLRRLRPVLLVLVLTRIIHHALGVYISPLSGSPAGCGGAGGQAGAS
ncbi:hypothetical protein, partial [Humitalea rosea]|uniref:hypothetical protein n=1 Tax=Humitalea rosea TaxID=990373 RepID=UPI001314B41F